MHIMYHLSVLNTDIAPAVLCKAGIVQARDTRDTGSVDHLEIDNCKNFSLVNFSS